MPEARAPRVGWLTAFLDLPAPVWGTGTAFWAAASGTTPSPVRGDHGELATLLPPRGGACWRVQRTAADDQPGIHLDLHAEDPAPLEHEVLDRGATLVRRSADVTVLRSPGGLPFCVVGDPLSQPPGPVRHGGHTSHLDQVCLDVPADRVDAEVAFWAGVLQLPATPSQEHPEFVDLPRPDHHAVRVLVQSVGDDGPVTAHPDLCTDDRAAEVARVVGLGARVETVDRHWTVLRAPDGRRFCVTDRDPWAGD